MELIFASKRSPGNNTPQGNTKLLGMWVVPSECIPEQAIMDQTWTWAQLWPLGMFRPRPNGPEVISRTFYKAWAQL